MNVRCDRTRPDDGGGALALGLAESVLRQLEERIDVVCSLVEASDADRDGKRAGVTGWSARARTFPSRLDFLSAHSGMLQRALGKDKREFFAAAAGQVFGGQAA
jgi:hypothetical protein